MREEGQASLPEKEKRTFLYTVARGLFGAWFRTFCPIRWHHYDPSVWQGGVILLSNHKTFADPLAVSVPIHRREVHWIGKKELGGNRFFAKVLRSLHVILIGRGETDMAAMRQCMKTLQKGHILGIFPEGTRHQQALMEKVETGAAFIALRSGAPMIPVYIHGKIRPFHVTHVFYGQPIPVEDLAGEGLNNDTVNALCQRIREVYCAMRDVAEKELREKK